jgi:signal peptidase
VLGVVLLIWGTLRIFRGLDTAFSDIYESEAANPFTDQASAENEPPVREEQVLAKALQINGQLVVLPKIGLLVLGSQAAMSTLQQQLAALLGTTLVLGTQGLSYLIFALGAAAYVASIIRGRGRGEREVRTRERDTGVVDVRLIIAALAAVLVVLVTASMTVAGGTQMYGIVSSDTDQPGARVIEKGTTEQTSYIVPSNGLLPVQVFLTPSVEGISVTPRELYVPSGEERTATVTLTAPPETGYYRLFLVEHRYLALLPRATIRSLHAIHPWAPIIAIDTLLTVGFLGIGFGILGTSKSRVRSRKSAFSTTDRVREWLGL